MTIIAEKMVAGGTALGRIDGKAYFIQGALPGETLDIEITENRKDYAFARIVSVKEANERRVTPPCPLFGRCGGCSLQMADAAYQVELRKSILADVLSRAHVQAETELRVESDSPWEYRSRFQFHRTRDGGIGLREGASETVVPIHDCPVAAPIIRKAIADGTIARAARGRNTGDRFHVFGYENDLWQEDGNEACVVSLTQKLIRFNVRGFFQSNVPMLERLLSAISDAPQGESPNFSGKRLLDFYSGVGTFSATVGDGFNEVVLVEHNREALAAARENLSTRESSARFLAISDERWSDAAESKLAYDCVIVDPPRLGMNKKTIDWLIGSSVSDIRSVSCDPVTFARDAARLVAGGFRLRAVTLFDFYPQTHHLETLAFFSR
jgi:23S rRNA (uracil1939-C5)-methyltransferase